MARSELLALAALCAGCDVVFDVGEPRACDPVPFDAAKGTPIVAAEWFSIDWDQTVAVITQSGLPYEYRFAGAQQAPIDLGPTINLALALAPEDDGLFFTTGGDPMQLMAAASHDGTTWTTGARVPAGTYAGTPSADAFGPRHVLVRLYDSMPAVQEYVDDSGVWTTVGDPHDVPGELAPNLTPNGLTMVYADTDGVYQATRASRDGWFGAPTLVLAGTHTAPQLLGRCSTLYTSDDGMLTRYRR